MKSVSTEVQVVGPCSVTRSQHYADGMQFDSASEPRPIPGAMALYFPRGFPLCSCGKNFQACISENTRYLQERADAIARLNAQTNRLLQP